MGFREELNLTMAVYHRNTTINIVVGYIHTGNFSWGLVGRGGQKRRSYRWRWSEL